MKANKFLIAIFSLVLISLFTSFKLSSDYADDFLEFWKDVKENYAYFDKKQTDWEKVKTVYLAKAELVKSRDELVTVFENAIEELYDNHFSLNTNLKTSPRLVPTGLDIWAEWINNRAIITEVRRGFSSEKAGFKAGMEIISINGVAIEDAVNKRVGKCLVKIDTEAKNYALKQLLAGTYIVNKQIVVKQNDKTSTINLDDINGNLTDHHTTSSLLDFKKLDGNIGYIKINNSLGETDLVQHFDSALLGLKDTKALIIDLRETPSGGNAIVARGMLSRFISSEMPFQKHVLPNEEKEYKVKRSWIELVTPRGPFQYTMPVIILVNHWTGSMGEGITIGFDAIGKAKIVGTRMAGLKGAISGFKTSKIKIPYSFPTEQIYHINGQPREDFRPAFYIDLTNPKYKDIADPVLTTAVNIADGK